MLNNFTETELSHEQWRDVDGYDGAYQVSDLGRVRSLKFGRVKVLRPGKINTGYFIVQLWRNGQGKGLLVHRLVAQAFIENDDNAKNEINHINELKSDNRASNLEWCDRRYNNTYNDIRYRRHHPQPKLTKIKELYDQNLTYEQNIEVFRENGISCSTDTIRRLRKDLGLIK